MGGRGWRLGQRKEVEETRREKDFRVFFLFYFLSLFLFLLQKNNKSKINRNDNKNISNGLSVCQWLHRVAPNDVADLLGFMSSVFVDCRSTLDLLVVVALMMLNETQDLAISCYVPPLVVGRRCSSYFGLLPLVQIWFMKQIQCQIQLVAADSMLL